MNIKFFEDLNPSVRKALGSQKFVHLVQRNGRASVKTFTIYSYVNVGNNKDKVEKLESYINNSSNKLSKNDKVYILGKSFKFSFTSDM